MNDHHNEDFQLVTRHLDALAEHFDTVQIFCTRQEQSDTINVHLGTGNWFARRGHVHQWCIHQDEEARLEVRRREEES